MAKPGRIVITGGSSGIGEALALHYASDGVFLGLTGRDADRLEAVAEACRAKGAVVEAKIIDVADADAMASWMEGLDQQAPIDLVIANAGVGMTPRGLAELASATRKTFDVNVHGVFNTIHPLLPAMEARGEGQVAIMASLAGFTGLPSAVSYSASKVAVKAYGEALRGALYHRGVKVNVICPGFVVSRMTDQNRFKMPFLMTAEKAARIIARGLAANKAIIAFPWQTSFSIRFIAALPGFLREPILRKAPKKQKI